MTTSNGIAHQAPLYVRVLRLRHLHVDGFVSFLLFECMIAVGVLLALAELVNWWGVAVLPAVVAIMVKVNDTVVGDWRPAHVQARVQVRAAERDSSDRASAIRLDPDARTGEAPSVSRRTATALDRAEIARVEPPSQRKKVGIVKVSIPAASDAPPAVPAPAAEEPVGAAGDEWTDIDAHGFQRSRPLHPSGWSGQPAQDPWAGHGAEPARPAAPDAQADWRGETGGWGDSAAWSTEAAGATAQANWADETGWADQAAWGSARSPYGTPPSWDPYGWESVAPRHTGEHAGTRPVFGQASHEQAAHDEAYRTAEEHADGYGRYDDAAGGYGRFDGAVRDHGWYEDTAGSEHRWFDDGHTGDGEGRPQSRESDGRHAWHQQPRGRRRSDDTDNVTSSHFATGRHAERQRRSDEDLARQRTGGLNQGRFA
ncbi:hypothetical protein [Dactylosporangium sp. NPDC051484]|uniref:hypothetical protein n=1 Tax=Dactylosporangium sp. NPDC051484 TaxID=3154942 RepID=UPI00344E3827